MKYDHVSASYAVTECCMHVAKNTIQKRSVPLLCFDSMRGISMEKNSFVLYTDYLEQLELLSMEQRGTLLTALMSYAAGLELPDMDSTAKMAFVFIKKQMERDAQKYRETVERRREAGKLGGLAKAEKARSKVEKTSTSSKAKKPVANASNAKNSLANASNAKNSLANLHDNDNENVYENVYDTDMILTDHSAREDLFEQFWRVYPKQVGRYAAQKAFLELSVDETLLKQILESVQQHKKCTQWQSSQFIPRPENFLSKRMFLEQPLMTKPKGDSSFDIDLLDKLLDEVPTVGG